MFTNRQKEIYTVLVPLYGERESKNILKILSESIEDFGDDAFQLLVKRLSNSEPWQYVIGKEWFYGLEFRVTSDTLIPRPETEELVHKILHENGNSPLNVYDIGTGSGCISIVLKKHRPQWDVYGGDISPKALVVARENAAKNQVLVNFMEEDILVQPFSSIKWDIIVSNPPYIPMEEKNKMRSNVTQFEPASALFVSDEDALIFYREIGIYAMKNLQDGGRLYFELNEFLAEDTEKLISELGFLQVKIHKDLMDKNRILSAVKKQN